MTGKTTTKAKQPHPVDVHVGRKIRIARHLREMTQKQLADAIGSKFQQLQKYETGVNRCSASKLHDISKALDMNPAALFDGLEGMSYRGMPRFDNAAGELAVRIGTLSRSDRTALTQIIERMAVQSMIQTQGAGA